MRQSSSPTGSMQEDCLLSQGHASLEESLKTQMPVTSAVLQDKGFRRALLRPTHGHSTLCLQVSEWSFVKIPHMALCDYPSLSGVKTKLVASKRL